MRVPVALLRCWNRGFIGRRGEVRACTVASGDPRRNIPVQFRFGRIRCGIDVCLDDALGSVAFAPE